MSDPEPALEGGAAKGGARRNINGGGTNANRGSTEAHPAADKNAHEAEGNDPVKVLVGQVDNENEFNAHQDIKMTAAYKKLVIDQENKIQGVYGNKQLTQPPVYDLNLEFEQDLEEAHRVNEVNKVVQKLGGSVLNDPGFILNKV